MGFIFNLQLLVNLILFKPFVMLTGLLALMTEDLLMSCHLSWTKSYFLVVPKTTCCGKVHY